MPSPTISTPYMALTLPNPTVQVGPTWASELNSAIQAIDAHDHSSGKGIPVPSAGISLNADLPFNSYNATLLRSTQFQSQGSPISLATDLSCLYASGGDLYYNDGSGNQIKLTASGALNAASIGAIGGLGGTTGSATYSSVSAKFTFWQASNVSALIDCGAITIRPATVSANGVSIAAANALSASYQLTLPTGLPASTKILSCDASGNLGVVYDVDNSTLEVASNSLRVKDSGISSAKIASSAVTSTKLASNLNLPGSAVQENGKNVVVSNTNATNSLAIVRGEVSALGAVSKGEGFTASWTGSGVCRVTFSTAFGDVPVCVAIGCVNQLIVRNNATVATTTYVDFTVTDFNNNLTTDRFSFIAIGQRA